MFRLKKTIYGAKQATVSDTAMAREDFDMDGG